MYLHCLKCSWKSSKVSTWFSIVLSTVVLFWYILDCVNRNYVCIFTFPTGVYVDTSSTVNMCLRLSQESKKLPLTSSVEQTVYLPDVNLSLNVYHPLDKTQRKCQGNQLIEIKSNIQINVIIAVNIDQFGPVSRIKKCEITTVLRFQCKTERIFFWKPNCKLITIEF